MAEPSMPAEPAATPTAFVHLFTPAGRAGTSAPTSASSTSDGPWSGEPDPDVGHLDRAAPRRPVALEQPGLQRRERHGAVRPHGVTRRLAGVGVDARGDVDGEDGRARRHHGRVVAAPEAGAVGAVDHQVARRQRHATGASPRPRAPAPGPRAAPGPRRRPVRPRRCCPCPPPPRPGARRRPRAFAGRRRPPPCRRVGPGSRGRPLRARPRRRPASRRGSGRRGCSRPRQWRRQPLCPTPDRAPARLAHPARPPRRRWPRRRCGSSDRWNRAAPWLSASSAAEPCSTKKGALRVASFPPVRRTSTSVSAKAPMPVPSAFITASLAAKRAARLCARSAEPLASDCSISVKQRAAKRGRRSSRRRKRSTLTASTPTPTMPAPPSAARTPTTDAHSTVTVLARLRGRSGSCPCRRARR